GQGKAGSAHTVSQPLAQVRSAQLHHGTALGADNQQVVGVATGIHTGRPGIDGIQAVNQTFFSQKVQSTVNGRGLGAGLELANQIQQFVGAQTALGLNQDFQHLAAN